MACQQKFPATKKVAPTGEEEKGGIPVKKVCSMQQQHRREGVRDMAYCTYNNAQCQVIIVLQPTLGSVFIPNPPGPQIDLTPPFFGQPSLLLRFLTAIFQKRKEKERELSERPFRQDVGDDDGTVLVVVGKEEAFFGG